MYMAFSYNKTLTAEDKYVTAVLSGPFVSSRRLTTGAYGPDEIPVMFFMLQPQQVEVCFICSGSGGSQL